MTPLFRIRADGGDATAAIADRLISLTLDDGDGMEADTLELVLDNRDRRVDEPATGARLDVALGFAGAPLVAMGLYTVNAVAGEGPLETLTIRAEAADLAGPIRSPRTETWEATTLPAIVERIAARAGLAPFVSPRLRDVAIPYEAQTAESDLHFLTRLARRFDAIAKPAGGRLVVAGRAEGTGPALLVARAEAVSWSWEAGARERYARVEARWADVDGGRERIVTVGAGEPVRELRRVHPSEREAREAAEAELARAGRGERTWQAALQSFRGDLHGGARVELAGFGPSMDGAGVVRRVRHLLDGEGLRTEVEGARTAEGAA